MFTAILGLSSSILIPLLKWILEKKAKRKLNDKDFVKFILAHRKRRGNAGQSAMDWKEAMKKAEEEIDALDNKLENLENEQ